MTQTLELTPAELEMIALKREQAALVAKHDATVKAIQLEKEIQAKKDSIAANKKKDQEQIAAARKYLLDFDTTQYSLDIKTSQAVAQVMGDYIDKENGFDRHILWSEVYERQSAVISHKGGQKVKVDEQIVYSSSWRSKGESKGYKMYICGPGIEYKQEQQALSRVKSVMEKIKTANDSIEYTKKKEENKRNALQVTVDRFKAEYPDAEVTTDYSYDRGNARSYSSGERYDIVRTKFVNGAQISYRVYANGSLSRVSFNLPGSKDEASFMKNLSQMNF
jgi:hypothetical protein